MPEAQIVPKFVVRRMQGSVAREIKKYQMREGKPDIYGRPTFHGAGFESETVTEPIGYMVNFPDGHSIRVRNDAELARLGFDKQAPLVDLVSGEEVPVSLFPFMGPRDNGDPVPLEVAGPNLEIK